MIQSQNNTMYVYRGGIEVGKYQINDIDSIIFINRQFRLKLIRLLRANSF